MRCLVLLLVVLAACDGGTQPVGPDRAPPLEAGCTEIGAFEIAAPRPELHYAPTMDVVINETELQGSLTLTMIDDLGNAYELTSESYAPYPNDGDIWWSQDKFGYQLAPNHRYTLTVTPQICTAYPAQTVEFFTSAS